MELSWHDALPLLFAFLLGGAIGFEREYHGRPAGLRTHILVCLSSAMLILISRKLGAVETEAGRVVFDPNRMGAGIVTGIGFLGASTVLRSGDYLRGLTTAACIWFVAGLGIVLGMEQYGLGTLCTAIVLVVLTLLNQAAGRILPIVYRRVIVMARREAIEPLVEEIRELLTREDIKVLDVASGRDNESELQELVFFVSLRNRGQAPRVTEGIAALEGVTQARWKLGPH